MIRFTRSLLVAAAVATATLAPVTAFAADEVNVTRGFTGAGAGLALRGFDAVSFFAGKPEVGSHKFTATHNGASYQFASQANLDTFKSNPAKYEPAYGGFCAYGAAVGKKFDGDPANWKIVDGRLYLNLNSDVQSLWLKDVPGHITKADGNWTRIKSVAVDKL